MPDPAATELPAGIAGLTPLVSDTCVVVMMGPSGAGKSWLAKLIAAICGGVATSYDDIRQELTGDPYAAHATTDAVALCRARTAQRLGEGLSTVIAATHTLREHREPWVALADQHRVPAVLVGVLTPLPVCLARQLERRPYVPGTALGRRVPDDVVRRQHAEVAASLPGLHEEGWAAIHLVGDTSTTDRAPR